MLIINDDIVLNDPEKKENLFIKGKIVTIIRWSTNLSFCGQLFIVATFNTNDLI